MAEIKETTIDRLIPDDRNFNKGTEYGKQLLDRSFGKFGAGRSVLLDRNNRIIAGNKATEAYGEGGGEKVIVVETDGTTLVAVKRTDVDLDSQFGRELALADNATQKADLAWDQDAIREVSQEWGFDASDWGTSDGGWASHEGGEDEDLSEEAIARKEAEFRQRMEAGEISEEDEEYQEFLDKFKLKKTTDDCYTPQVVYDAVAEWVAATYGVNRARFVRPFYPGGDYQNEKYPEGCVVVDNPPFSIMSEILNFYKERGIRFFLFAPTLTLFSSSSSSSSTAIPLGVPVTYENGANVNTSFLTNLEDPSVRLKSSPTLYAAVKEANDRNLKELRRELPKYSYDHHVITSTFVGQLSRLGIDFEVPVAESVAISQLDAQKESGKAIFGKGYLVSDKVYAEREKAEREKAEHWELSDREWVIVRKLKR